MIPGLFFLHSFAHSWNVSVMIRTDLSLIWMEQLHNHKSNEALGQLWSQKIVSCHICCYRYTNSDSRFCPFCSVYSVYTIIIHVSFLPLDFKNKNSMRHKIIRFVSFCFYFRQRRLFRLFSSPREPRHSR